MAICGHQFHGGDETDWILCTSLDGSTTASRILHELFKKHSHDMSNKTPRKKPKTFIPTNEDQHSKPETHNPEENENFIVKKITGTWSFVNFDESQHLNGCPMKWLYHKKLLERNKLYKVARPCAKKSAKKEEIKKEKKKNVRDKTPIEVKIHKINLIEKYTNNNDEFLTPYLSFPRVRSKDDSKDLEMHRKKLAAKLNWKLHDESPEERSIETSSEISSRHNYLPPRPLLGLKPLLSVLLAPQQETSCCSLVQLKPTSPIKRNMKASLSIQSLDLSFSLPKSNPRFKKTNSLRWGSKSSSHGKKLQIPTPITLNLEEKKKKLIPNSGNQLKVVYASSPPKKLNDRSKSKSLTSLFYELSGKTNYRNENEKYFEEMIRDLTMEEGQFKIKRFLNISSANSDLAHRLKVNPEKRKKLMKASSTDSELNLVCEKARFFQKKSTRGATT